MKKTNFMVISSNTKEHININIHNIECKNCIKYLGIYLDEHLNWKSQIVHVNNKIAKNIGIFYKLRHYLNIHMLKQLYYNLIYPYLTYGVMSWGNTYSTNLTKIRTKQNKCIRSIFFTALCAAMCSHIFFMLQIYMCFFAWFTSNLVSDVSITSQQKLYSYKIG